MFDAGKPTEKYPTGKPFDISMLYECVPLLQPTPEIIHQAWTFGLEYNIGTSCMGFNAMSVVCESVGMSFEKLFAHSPDSDPADFLQEDSELTELQAEHETRTGENAVTRPWRAPNPNSKPMVEFPRLFGDANDRLTKDDVEQKAKMLANRREARCNYRYKCSRAESGSVAVLKDVRMVVEQVLGKTHLNAEKPAAEAAEPMDADMHTADAEGGPRNEDPEDDAEPPDDLPRNQLGAWLFAHGREPDEEEDDIVVLQGYHEARGNDREFGGPDNCVLDHKQMEDPLKQCPYCNHGAHGDNPFLDPLYDGPGDAEVGIALDLATLSEDVSALWPDTIEATLFYKEQTICNITAGGSAHIDPAGCVMLMTRPLANGFNYMKRTNSHTGAARLDTAWLQPEGACEQWKSWHKAAEHVRNRTDNKCVKQFDLHVDGLRDSLYLLSTRDNARFVQEEPWLQPGAKANKVVMSIDSKQINSKHVIVQPSPYSIPGSRETVEKAHEHKPRHPDSNVKDTVIQRRMDSMYHGQRLTALGIFCSNRVSCSPPIRMHQDGLVASVSACVDHVNLVAEAVLTASKLPGLENMQENFCNNQKGPDGLSAPASSVGSKRKATRDPSTPDSVHTLAYSYDIVSIFLAQKTGSMLYDDLAGKFLPGHNAKYSGMLGGETAFDSLPHLSTRFPGYAVANKQTLSLKLAATRDEKQAYVEAGDPSRDESEVSEEHVRMALNRDVTEEDIVKYIAGMQGSRSMNGTTGDLFASSTWFEHTVHTLKQRGLLRETVDDPFMRCYKDMLHCLDARVLEHLSIAGAADYSGLNLKKTNPNTYAALRDKALQGKGKGAPPPKSYRSQANKSAFDVASADWGPAVPPPAPPPERAPEPAAGAGGSRDAIRIHGSAPVED